MSENHLQNKTVVITGAGNGFGQLVAKGSATLGANVVCADVDTQAVADTAASINAANGAATSVVADVTDVEQMHELAERAVSEYGAIDIWINNAGTMPLAFYTDHKAAHAQWARCLDINIKGVLNGICACHDQMLAQGRGHVVNMSSIYGNFPVVGAGVYGATKAAVNFLSESLRVESQGKIKVTTIRPTGVPATGLGAGIVNPQAIVGILGQNVASYGELMGLDAAGELPPERKDPNHISYYALAPEHLAEQVIYAINQPWGVSIGDVTVRATGDEYIL